MNNDRNDEAVRTPDEILAAGVAWISEVELEMLVARLDKAEEALRVARLIPSEYDLLTNAVARAMYEIAGRYEVALAASVSPGQETDAPSS